MALIPHDFETSVQEILTDTKAISHQLSGMYL